MKLKIADGNYSELKLGRCVCASALNDFVSTTRKDAAGQIHQYESRWSLMNAFMHASKSKRVRVVCNNCTEEMVVRVLGLGSESINGLTFYLDLRPLEMDEEEEG